MCQWASAALALLHATPPRRACIDGSGSHPCNPLVPRLVDAFLEYDEFFALSRRQYVHPNFAELRHIFNIAQVHAWAAVHVCVQQRMFCVLPRQRQGRGVA